ncbi:MAG: sodium-dependent transporter [Clostridium sp.]|nr:sodium-dependent transporter [Clostridium sp.]
MSINERANFSSKIGIILASAGSAVGLGNIWRFPCEVGSNGGAAFILIYLLCIALLGIPVMVSEFLIGRHSKANTASAYERLAPGTPWKWLGMMGVVAAFLILSYYAVVAGWTLEYMFASATGELSRGHDFTAFFNSFVSNPWKPVLYLAGFLLLTHVVIVRGVKEGIERFSKVMMPMLLLIICILVICSFSMPGSIEGLTFLLKPDFSKVTTKVVLSAMGQAFFSLSLGMGCLCTYASYFSDDANLMKTAGSVSVIDTIVAVMAGFIIFPAVYSVQGLSPDAGPGLVFITLPNVFNIAFGEVPWLGYLFSLMFYVLLVLAALTSTISLHEVPTAYIHERYGLSRRNAARVVTGSCIFLGLFCSLSFGVLSDVTCMGMTVFDLFDFVTAKLIMPLGGMLISIFTGWYLNRELVKDEVTNRGRLRLPFFGLYLFILRYVAPVAIGIIFFNELFNR